MNVEQMKELGIRVFFVDAHGNYYECFDDQSRKRVDKCWLHERMAKNIYYDFRYLMVSANNVDYNLENQRISQEKIELYKHFGII